MMWPTPKASLRGDCPSERNRRTPDLVSAVKMTGAREGLNASGRIPTPRAEDSESHRGKPDTLTSWTRAEADTDTPVGSLNPDWVELLMGWPLGWTSLDPLPRENWARWLETGGAWSEGQTWATPTLYGNYNRKGASPNSGDGLETQVRQSFASPCAGDSVGNHGGGMGRSLRTDIHEWKQAHFPTPSANKTTRSGELVNADGTPWDGVSKPHSATTGQPVQTALADALTVPNPTAAWEQGVPRVAVGVPKRQARLKAIGNGQVPMVAAMAWHILKPQQTADALIALEGEQ